MDSSSAGCHCLGPAVAVTPSKKGVSFDTVSKLARHLPGVVESTSYGTRALKVHKRLIARLKEDGKTMTLRVDFASRDLMLRDNPSLFFLTDHYRDYPTILLRLAVVRADQLKELIEDAWRLTAPPRLVAAYDAGRKRP